MSTSRLDLYDYRRRVAAHYRERDERLAAGDDPAEVVRDFREARDRLFAEHPQSALANEDREAFERLEYFAYDPEACVEAEIDTAVEPGRIRIAISEDEVVPLERVATLHFSYQGVAAQLTLYWIDLYGGGLFLPFRDATAPAETYGAGRYLFDTVKGSTPVAVSFQQSAVSSQQSGDRRFVVLDFNYAYNPSCAYNPDWVCPLAPQENHLAFPIRAGEKKFR